jgi:hypothetical protein
MKPKPFASLNHFTVPVVRAMLLYSVLVAAPPTLRVDATQGSGCSWARASPAS